LDLPRELFSALSMSRSSVTLNCDVNHGSSLSHSAAVHTTLRAVNSVDRWLNTVTKQSGMESMQGGFVECLVKGVCVKVRLSGSGDVNCLFL